MNHSKPRNLRAAENTGCGSVRAKRVVRAVRSDVGAEHQLLARVDSKVDWDALLVLVGPRRLDFAVLAKVKDCGF